MKSIQFFGARLNPLTMAETVDVIDRRISTHAFTQHVVVNVAKLVNMQEDSDLAKSIRECDIVNIDGMGIVWGGRLLGHSIPERVAGVDLFDALIELSSRRGYPVFLLGAQQGVVEEVARVIQGRYPALKVAGYHHGYFWTDEQAIVEQIAASGARLLFVAISSPNKENFINRWKAALGVDFVMGVGGTFDVTAGKVRRAPPWMRAAGLEWLYRVYQEPRRMWRRYASTNFTFGAMLLRALVSRISRG